jgi:hypothetical protein
MPQGLEEIRSPPGVRGGQLRLRRGDASDGIVARDGTVAYEPSRVYWRMTARKSAP